MGQLLRYNSKRNTVFLFDGKELIAASDHAEIPGQEIVEDWQSLRRFLCADFPGFPADPISIRDAGELSIFPIDASQKKEVHCEWIDGVIRVELRVNRADRKTGKADDLDAADNDVLAEVAPYPIWQLDPLNRVTWCNAAYSDLVRKLRPGGPGLDEPFFPNPGTNAANELRNRVEIGPDHDPLWYDVSFYERSGGYLCYAVNINAVVEAENTRRNFVQTLTKTFAQLSIALAIFDRNRQLSLFNPALTDLTALPTDFLISRPSMSSFFDRLRNQNMMPEPKDYGSWRQQMDSLLSAAANGHYQETWSLPSGSVYSVTGRPHPDGAIAFLFEDITAEITLTRRFRAEVDQTTSILDKIEDAIVVFAPDGTLTYANQAYKLLWGVDPDAAFAAATVLDATKTWQNACSATPVWGEIRDFVDAFGDRADWWAQVKLRDGSPLTTSVIALPKRATMVLFSRETIRRNTKARSVETV